jgi:hypothetical protein
VLRTAILFAAVASLILAAGAAADGVAGLGFGHPALRTMHRGPKARP